MNKETIKDSENTNSDDIERLNKFVDTIDIKIDKSKRYIPVFNKDTNSKTYLYNLAFLGLKKRLNDKVSDIYIKRLNYELDVIDKMGFNDYFLIVYDYVKYAKKNGVKFTIAHSHTSNQEKNLKYLL